MFEGQYGEISKIGEVFKMIGAVTNGGELKI